MIADPDRTLSAGALAIVQETRHSFRWRQLQTLAQAMGFSLAKPWRQLPEAARRAILYGTEEELDFAFIGQRSRWEYRGRFEGLIPNLERRYRESKSQDVRNEIERYMSMSPCHACGGKRLRREALAVRVGGSNINEVVRLAVKDAVAWFGSLSLSPREQTIAHKILKEIKGHRKGDSDDKFEIKVDREELNDSSKEVLAKIKEDKRYKMTIKKLDEGWRLEKIKLDEDD